MSDYEYEIFVTSSHSDSDSDDHATANKAAGAGADSDSEMTISERLLPLAYPSVEEYFMQLTDDLARFWLKRYNALDDLRQTTAFYEEGLHIEHVDRVIDTLRQAFPVKEDCETEIQKYKKHVAQNLSLLAQDVEAFFDPDNIQTIYAGEPPLKCTLHCDRYADYELRCDPNPCRHESCEVLIHVRGARTHNCRRAVLCKPCAKLELKRATNNFTTMSPCCWLCRGVYCLMARPFARIIWDDDKDQPATPKESSKAKADTDTADLHTPPSSGKKRGRDKRHRNIKPIPFRLPPPPPAPVKKRRTVSLVHESNINGDNESNIRCVSPVYTPTSPRYELASP